MDPISAYVEPIRKKWVYHFIISPKTNIIDKPEWYLNQTLKWIYEHVDIVESKFKTDQNGESGQLPAKHRFILCMIEMAVIRLTKDMKTVSKDLEGDTNSVSILTHTYNEVIKFTKVVRQLLGPNFYTMDDKYDLLSVMSEQTLFEKIIDVEWECAKRNLKNITTSDTRWDPVLEGDYTDNYKIPRCVDRLLMLNKSITERVNCFRQPDCQFQLIELQCFIFNKFLSFLKKSTETSAVSKNILSEIFFFGAESTVDISTTLRVINGVNFLRLVLKERYFIPVDVMSKLDCTLANKSNKLAQDYKSFFYHLVGKIVSIYNYVDCDLKYFLNFIQPKLSHHIFEIVRDEASKLNQEHQTHKLIEGFSVS